MNWCDICRLKKGMAHLIFCKCNCHKPMTESNWEQRFEKQFPAFLGIGAPFPIFDQNPNREHIKSFISQELSTAKEQGIQQGYHEAFNFDDPIMLKIEKEAHDVARTSERQLLVEMLTGMYPNIDYPYSVEECAMRVKTIDEILSKLKHHES